jgi:hypothetical protein
VRRVYLQELASQIDELHDRAQIEAALDQLEYLMEVLDPELQDPAYDLAEKLREKLLGAAR